MTATIDRAKVVQERLAIPDAFLSRSDLAALGLAVRAIDSIFRRLPTFHIPGYSRPLIRVGDYVALLEESRFEDDRVL